MRPAARVSIIAFSLAALLLLAASLWAFGQCLFGCEGEPLYNAIFNLGPIGGILSLVIAWLLSLWMTLARRQWGWLALILLASLCPSLLWLYDGGRYVGDFLFTLPLISAGTLLYGIFSGRKVPKWQEPLRKWGGWVPGLFGSVLVVSGGLAIVLLSQLPGTLSGADNPYLQQATALAHATPTPFCNGTESSNGTCYQCYFLGCLFSAPIESSEQQLQNGQNILNEQKAEALQAGMQTQQERAEAFYPSLTLACSIALAAGIRLFFWSKRRKSPGSLKQAPPQQP